MSRRIPVRVKQYPTVALGNLDRGEGFIRTNPKDPNDPCVYMSLGLTHRINCGRYGCIRTVSLRSGAVHELDPQLQVVRVELDIQAFING